MVPRLLPSSGTLKDLVRLRTGLEKEFASNLFQAKVWARRQGRLGLGAALDADVDPRVPKLHLRRDFVAAEREAKRLAGVWGQKVIEAANDPKTRQNPIIPASAKMRYRYDIVTEVQANESWNDERHRAAREVEIPGMVLIKTWSAMGERRTCGICSGLDGRSILAEDHWPLGDPGTVHPHCRCDEAFESMERWRSPAYAA